MERRYELTDEQWEKMKNLLPGKEGDRGRTAKDNRNFLNGVLWVLRSGARWADLPGRYGKYKSVHKRFTRWARKQMQQGKILIASKQFPFLKRKRLNMSLLIRGMIAPKLSPILRNK